MPCWQLPAVLSAIRHHLGRAGALALQRKVFPQVHDLAFHPIKFHPVPAAPALPDPPVPTLPCAAEGTKLKLFKILAALCGYCGHPRAASPAPITIYPYLFSPGRTAPQQTLRPPSPFLCPEKRGPPSKT